MPKKHNGSSRGFPSGKTSRAFRTVNKPPACENLRRGGSNFVPYHGSKNPTPGYDDLLKTIRSGESII